MAMKSLYLAALAFAIAGGIASPAAAQDAKGPAKEKKAPKDKTPKDIPTEEQIAAKKVEVLAAPLFQSSETLPFTLIANFKAIGKDRDTLSARRFPAQLIWAGASGAMDTMPVQLRTRGHYRLEKCSIVPLRIEFPKKESKGTVFDGQKSLKLGTHCQKDNTFEQYVLREYLAYRVQAIVSPIALRVRLTRTTYVDSATGTALDTRYGLLVESEDHMAARAGGVVREMRRALFDNVDEEILLNMTIFEYMIGNTDWSISALHNVRIVATPTGQLIPIAYDFDFSGLVDARYASVDPRLPIKRVRDRLFRGPCKTAEEWEPTLASFRSKKAEVLALYDSLPGLDKGYAKDSQDYLRDFFRTLDRASDVRGEIVENCNRQGGT